MSKKNIVIKEQKNNMWVYTAEYKLQVITDYKEYKQIRLGRAILRNHADMLGLSYNTMYKYLADWRKEFRCMVSN